MDSNRFCTIGIGVVLVFASTILAGVRADLSGDAVVDFQTTMGMPFMTVGNSFNAADSTGYGAVDYLYNIAKFEVTAGQYTEFLNAVAATDTYGLYNTVMWTDPYGCKIQRSGVSGSYTYSVAADWADRPVNNVSWGDAARLCNWLTNGMPTGSQGLTTTEDGSYFLNGATSRAALLAVQRTADAVFVIPSEDEWYKAAYHANDGATGNYFDYPTATDTPPSNDLLATDAGNNANFHIAPADWTIDSPYYRTEVGDFENSASPYGTFDQGGNVWEWTEAVELAESDRVFRGGVFQYPLDCLHADTRLFGDPAYGAEGVHSNLSGIRIVQVPEPATMSLLALGGVVLLGRRQK